MVRERRATPSEATAITELSQLYYLAELDESRARCDALVGSGCGREAELYARTVRMMCCIAQSDAQAAYRDLVWAVPRCEDGLAHEEDLAWHATATLSALRIESVLAANVFDDALMEAGIEDMPSDLMACYGSLLSLRLIRRMRFQVATGVSYAFTKMVSRHWPTSRVGLATLMASTHLLEGLREEARADFALAWELRRESGVVMPLVEFNYLLLGLQRNCGDMVSPEERRYMERLVRHFHTGWFELRRMCGLSASFETLTTSECYAMVLAGLGWRNKEIATHLGLSENTVKHQLTSVFGKLGISKRTEIRPVVVEQLTSSPSWRA